jgi:hypothetical protein
MGKRKNSVLIRFTTNLKLNSKLNAIYFLNCSVYNEQSGVPQGSILTPQIFMWLFNLHELYNKINTLHLSCFISFLIPSTSENNFFKLILRKIGL